MSKYYKFDTSKLPDNFKKQICEQINSLIDEIKDLKEEINRLKRPRK